MTVDQIRSELDMTQSLYNRAIEHNLFTQAEQFWNSITRLEQMMITAIQAEDPYTSAADIRYFENFITN